MDRDEQKELLGAIEMIDFVIIIEAQKALKTMDLLLKIRGLLTKSHKA